MEEPSVNIQCWHGSQRWSGQPSVQPVSKGRYESGPGLYLTTRRQTAAKYARGAGSLVVVEIDPNVCFLEDAFLTRAQMQEALDLLPRLRRRSKIEEDLNDSARRHPDGQLPAIYLVNLCVNHEALTGDNGPRLARWLSEQGIDASLDAKSGKEDWMVIFNPDIIVGSRKLTAAQADTQFPWEFPQIKAQLAALQPAPSPRARGPK